MLVHRLSRATEPGRGQRGEHMERDGDSTTPPTDARPNVAERSATFIGSFALLGRIVERASAFGLIILIASVYGSSFHADLYFIASIGPLLIGSTVGEAIGTALLPALVRAEPDREEEQRVLASAFWLVFAGLVAIAAVYVGGVAIVVHAQAPAGSARLAPWLAFAPLTVLLGLSGYLAAVLLRFQRYIWPPFRMAIASVGALVFTGIALLFSHDIAYVGAAVSAGWAVSVGLMFVEAIHAAGTSAFGRPSRAAARKVLGLGRKTASAALSSLLGGQVFVLLERLIASTAGVGAVATLSYARGIAFAPSILGQAVAAGIYPGMVRAHERREPALVQHFLLRSLRLTLFIGACVATYFLIYGDPVASAVLQRGQLGAAAAVAVGAVLSAFSLAVVGNMLLILASRTFFAIDYFAAAALAQGAVLVVYVVVAVPFREAWGLSGLALAFGVAELSGGITGLVLAVRRLGMSGGVLAREAVLPALARGAFIAVLLLIYRLGIHLVGVPLHLRGLVDMGGSGLVLVVASIVVLWFAGWPETERIKSVAGRMLGRVR